MQVNVYASAFKAFLVVGFTRGWYRLCHISNFANRFPGSIKRYATLKVRARYGGPPAVAKRAGLALALVCSFAGLAFGDPVWELKKESGDIRVYSGISADSKTKAVKVTCTLNADVGQLAALILDVKGHEQWVYHTRQCSLVKQLGPGSLVYYSEVAMPWPFSNRDVVVRLDVSQEPVSHIMHVTAHAVDNYVPEQSGKVRVHTSNVSWTVTPIANNQLNIEYIAEAGPGGEVPAWLVNSFATKGPFETFVKLKEVIALPAYANSQYAFLHQ